MERRSVALTPNAGSGNEIMRSARGACRRRLSDATDALRWAACDPSATSAAPMPSPQSLRSGEPPGLVECLPRSEGSPAALGAHQSEHSARGAACLRPSEVIISGWLERKPSASPPPDAGQLGA